MIKTTKDWRGHLLAAHRPPLCQSAPGPGGVGETPTRLGVEGWGGEEVGCWVFCGHFGCLGFGVSEVSRVECCGRLELGRAPPHSATGKARKPAVYKCCARFIESAWLAQVGHGWQQHACMPACMHAWMDGRTDGQRDGQMFLRTDRIGKIN